MVSFKLPAGIKIPEANDYPKRYDVKSINEQRDSANIVEGYNIRTVAGENYSHYAEANIDADRLWDVFVALTKRLISENAYGIIAFKEKEPHYGGLADAVNLINIFNEFKYELTNDGFLEFGIASENNGSFNEVFVTSFKYMNIFTSDAETLTKTFKKLNIQQTENLQFIDEFPIESDALEADAKKGIRHYSDVIKSIEKEFKKFPNYQ